MTTVQVQIAELEEALRQAELRPDPEFFQRHVADEAVMVSEDGKSAFAKAQIVEAHRPGEGPKFTAVEMNDMRILDHGVAAVVTCSGTYQMSNKSFTLRFMRVWVKKDAGWQIVAGTVSKSS